MTPLTPEQVWHFWEHGYVNGVGALTPAEVQRFLAEFEQVEAAQDALHGGLWLEREHKPWLGAEHPLEDWFIELATHPRVLDAVESVLGPHLLVRNADVFTKEVISEETVRWHLDTAETGPLADKLVTAWIGLTESTALNGGMEFVAGSHRQTLRHGPTDKEQLSLSPEAIAELDPDRIVCNVQHAGELSLHHFRMVHQSRDNWSEQRRVAFVVRYMTPEVTQEIAECGTAMLVRGTDPYRNFQLKGSFPVSWAVDGYVKRERMGELQ